MLKDISNEELIEFFESKTGLTVNKDWLVRDDNQVTIILEDEKGDYYVSFQVSDTNCTALPRERLGNMKELWLGYLNLKQDYVVETSNLD